MPDPDEKKVLATGKVWNVALVVAKAARKENPELPVVLFPIEWQNDSPYLWQVDQILK